FGSFSHHNLGRTFSGITGQANGRCQLDASACLHAPAVTTMDIMMRLKGAGFSAIANEFKLREQRLGGGLPLLDFIEIVLRGLPRPRTPEEQYANVNALVDLFDDIDINGDGAMEFDEFTSFCVDAGMVATRAKNGTLKHRYVRNVKQVLKTSSGCLGIDKIKWSAEFQRFLVIESSAKTVKLFNVDGKFMAEVGGVSAMSLLGTASDTGEKHNGGSSAEADEAAKQAARALEASATIKAAEAGKDGGGVFVLDAVFLHRYKWIALSTTDFTISFYNLEESHHAHLMRTMNATTHSSAGPMLVLMRNLTITTATAQLLLRFCEQAGLLFSTGNDFVLNVWKIIDADTKVLWKRLISHVDMVMDVLEIPHHEVIVSCDLHHTLQLWDIHDCRPRGTLAGHARGVKQLVYSSHHDLLLSAGFEYDAYGWDLASRQVIMKLSGHRAPLIGVQLALFHTERAVTADVDGVFKVWDISRGNGVGGTVKSHHGHGSGAIHALQLESIDPARQFSRFQPTNFICLHPVRRDIWAATAGSASLHLFRSVRVQQYDEIPLRAFYHYNANKFIVVSGPMCSIWDGETGTLVEEFTHVGGPVNQNSDAHIMLQNGSAPNSQNSHNGSGAIAGENEGMGEILTCTQDARCKKLIVVSEQGDMGVYNCLNFVQMRRCKERFRLRSSTNSKNPSCGIVGLHYCSANKLIIAADANESAILVIDDNNSDAAKGLKETSVLRRLVHLEGGVAGSAYSYHASLIATIAAEDGRICLWDFETLSLYTTCQFEEDENAKGSSIHLLEFWDEFPVLVGADVQGGINFFAVMPTKHVASGRMLHAFLNDHSNAEQSDATPGKPASTPTSSSNMHYFPTTETATTTTTTTTTTAATDTATASTEKPSTEQSKTFITEAAEGAARKMLQLKQRRETSHSLKLDPVTGETRPGWARERPSNPSCIVASMKIVYEDEHERYLLFTGDEQGFVRVWDLSRMTRRLALSKIPESKLKHRRRGYHPKAMFARDHVKEEVLTKNQKHHGTAQSMWRHALAMEESDKFSLEKRLQRRRPTTKRRSTAATSDGRTARGSTPSLSNVGGAGTGGDSSAMAIAKAFMTPGKKTSKVGFQIGQAVDGSLIQLRHKPEARSNEQAWHVQDVLIACAWRAHDDGTTSLEVTKHPNILVTCGLDMRVFVWNWHGVCLGKLFDAENVGRWRWRFQKDDSKRQKERHELVCELLAELEMTAAEKAERRRTTLYQEHVQHKSQKDLQFVNLVLLDHLINKSPEVQATEATDGDASGDPAAEVATTTDPSQVPMNRNRQNKLGMRMTLKHLKEQHQLRHTDTERNRQRAELRLQCLGKVGPLLCVDNFERKVANDAEMMKFYEKDDLKMDKRYLEQELSIALPPSLSGSQRGQKESMDRINQQIQIAHDAAETMIENRAVLERKAEGMYANLEHTKRKVKVSLLSPDRHRILANEAAASALNEMLEPSEFLEHRLPAAMLTLRPQTAPVVPINNSTKKKSMITSASEDKLPQCEPKPRPTTSTGTRKSLHVTHSAPQLEKLPRARRSVMLDTRKSSLDVLYIEEVKRQRVVPRKPSPLVVNTAQSEAAAPADKRLLLRSGNNQSASMATMPSIHEDLAHLDVKEQSLRDHMLKTEQRMEEAMHDAEQPHDRFDLKKARHNDELMKKEKRMDDYLRQKRRELNNNIGNVFKRTSFAFQSRSSDDRRNKKPAAIMSKAKLKLEKSSKFGIYSVREVMAVIRLFWSMDDDSSGSISLEELLKYKHFFEKLGYNDMTTVFQAIDKDGNGTISLRELLEICFHYATKAQIGEMMRLAKVGNVRSFLQGIDPEAQARADASALTEESRRELLDIFHVFDKNHDGGVTMDEIMEALRVDDDDVMAKVMADERMRNKRPLSVTSWSAFTSGITKEDIDRYYREFDSDGNKELNFDEFIGLMQALYMPKKRIGSTGEIAIPGLDKAIRRASLTCRQSLDEKDKSAGNSRTDMESYFRLQKRSVFGIYSVRGVMGVIRLFHVLDEDNSNTVSLSELQYIRPFFERIGQYDLSKVFHAIDKDNNGQISLRELLESCFPQSSNVQLSKVGNVRQFFRGATEADASSSGVSSLTHENKQELLDIFRIFDKNGDGFVSMDEIMQALRIDDSEHEIERAVAERRRVKLATEGVGAVGVTVTTAAPSSRSMGSSGITRSDMERYYAEYDVNGDKVLDFDEFVELMRALYE
ncbi:TPA: LOW QUALITY PROTEIN: hypothetical protein N0F65_005091, partial [Lagenidium giganteum]